MANLQIVTTVPDSVNMNRETFKQLLGLNSTARKFGFSVKHSKDIQACRSAVGSQASQAGLYDLPITWNVKETYFAR